MATHVNPSRRTLMHPGPAIAALAGTTAALGPYAYAFGDSIGALEQTGWFPQPWSLLAACAAVTLGGLTTRADRTWDQGLLTVGVVGVALSLAPALADSPSLTLAVLLLAVGIVFEAWHSDDPLLLRTRALIPTRGELAGTAARAATLTAAAATVALSVGFGVADRFHVLPGFAVAAGMLLRWATEILEERQRLALTAVALTAASAGLYWLWGAVAGHILLVASALVVIPSNERKSAAESPAMLLQQHPAGPLVTSFLLLCAGGSLLLFAPWATTVQGGVHWIDAVFTAVSAVCVTGLITLDTPHDFTLWGQAVILLLIQLGALGIMSYSAAIIITLGKRLGLREERAVASSLSAADRSQLQFVLRRLLTFTFATEAIGAALLATMFRFDGDSLPQAVWRGLFTSVSAFCNAGFALQTDSLIPYQTNPGVLHVVAALIILGGLSPAAALAVPNVLRGKERRAQVQIALAVTAILLVLDFVLVAAFEWQGTLADLSTMDRLHNAWFQSVTLRTAGFNSIPLEAVQPSTLLVMMISMFIGGSPGGTAGGIKTTTAAVMALSVLTAIRGRKEAATFGRRIPTETVDRAAAIVTLGLGTLFLIILALLLTQVMPMEWAAFEAVSALATVGLTIGGTGALDVVGKIVIVFAMFAGRVGPLSLFAFLSSRESVRESGHPAEPIDVG
ncbi:MAG: potassium transporter TrkH [Acidobacteria bacterium]|nr:potassium transporter TrkH [Acidobacteriota bacterium]